MAPPSSFPSTAKRLLSPTRRKRGRSVSRDWFAHEETEDSSGAALPTGGAGREVGQRGADLRIHQPVWLRDRRRCQDRRVCGDSKRRESRESLQNLQSQFHL